MWPGTEKHHFLESTNLAKQQIFCFSNGAMK